ncbi:RagB/SusD family nutrient uptake outer membrane protein [Alistipes sp. kh20]|uniref:RagB/SusD family nutrient uptake outer membrane protein n=1 Tax=Alistipes TaxID=239759 RepID=UPI001898C874|nr:MULTISPECIES: RagB/SusD family nutrient uptake outer membrane protein [Alistipes]MBS4767011.1 RagB/SusD family nutrient uptake outer membrane protein [Alistipes montrealensis]
MKAINKIWIFALGTAVMASSCSDLDTFPESGVVTEDQKKEVVEDNPDRLQADINTLSSIFVQLLPNWAGGNDQVFHNDFSYPAVCIATDGNGSDMVSDNSDYEWFSVAFEYSDRNANYAVPLFTWNFCYRLNKQANDILATIPEDTDDEKLIHYRGQALVARAFAHFTLAQRFQFTYKGNEDKPTVPIVTWDMPVERVGANPRATNAEIYKQIYDDLTQAISDLEGFQRSGKSAVNQNVAYGMRARVNLVMNNWGEAATDAASAMEGFSLLTKEDVSAPGFNEATASSWIWAGLYKAADTPANYRNITWGGHLCSFNKGYTTSQGLYKRINSLLYNMIPETDVRKGWWIDTNLSSPLLDHMDWDGVTGSAISSLSIPNVKRAFVPYTNVKFAPFENKCGTDINAGDWCIMRAEEMLLIQAEAMAMGGNLNGGKSLLENWVKTYRNEEYTCAASTPEAFQNEVWLQRRIELWGEGHAYTDIMRLKKNVVRCTTAGKSDFPDAWAFNIAADDGILLMRIPTRETNANAAIDPIKDNNTGGTFPVHGSGAGLTDGVVVK